MQSSVGTGRLRADVRSPAPPTPPDDAGGAPDADDAVRVETTAPKGLRLTIERQRWWRRLLRPFLEPFAGPPPDPRLARRACIRAGSPADREALTTSPDAQTALLDLFRAGHYWPVEVQSVRFADNRARVEARLLEPLDEEASRRLHTELQAHLDAAAQALGVGFRGRSALPSRRTTGASPLVMLGLLAFGLVAMLMVAML